LSGVLGALMGICHFIKEEAINNEILNSKLTEEQLPLGVKPKEETKIRL